MEEVKPTHRVLRPVPTGADSIPAGTEVDASGWLYTDLLVRQGYLQPIENEPVLSLDDTELEQAKTRPWEVRAAA